ncbi:hypothetical protein GGR53DRAFT_284316 [Hypoxylon sp. FL1150]|nr:hypothetical protein GGR53DRAFT_284316 [Hypoxylon sp. FL1150]
MAKPKAFLKQAKPKPNKEQKLNTADDFQAAGVDFEEAAGKWRAGDAAKSMRFFQRAVDVYAQGLSKFPQSIDLAYNKARVQLEIATHPILVDQLQRPLQKVLEEALASHRYVLQLDPDNADALFNTSQVLTALAEDLASDEDDKGNQGEAQALKILYEALDFQSKCLSVQEHKYQEFLEQGRLANEQEEEVRDDQPMTDTNSNDNTPQEDAEEEAEWFNVVEPVTHDTLIDTIVAQLGTLTTFCSIISSSPEAAPANSLLWAEELSGSLLLKVQTFSSDQPERLQEIALTKGNLVSTMLEARYKSGKIDAETYKQERDTAFAAAEFQLERSSEGLIANARSLLAFNSALIDAHNGDSHRCATLLWNAITASIANLKYASAIQGISQEDLATTHLLRGDASMYLYTMSYDYPGHPSYQKATDSAAQNIKNAEVYYRNASRLSQDQEEKDVSSLKSAVAHSCSEGAGDLSFVRNASPRDSRWTTQQLEDMLAENLILETMF